MTTIPYLDEVWNVTHGCTKVSAGCAHCYAARLSERFPHGGNFGDVLPRESQLDKPLHWRRPRRVGVCFMSDLFHEKVPEEFIARVFARMARCPQHTFLLLTKRPQLMKELVGFLTHPGLDLRGAPIWPLPNVWLGVSVENQQAADERIPLLLETPAAHRWVSVEPLLSKVDLGYVRDKGEPYQALKGWGSRKTGDGKSDIYPGERLDWVVVGGESGPKAREMPFRALVNVVTDCGAAGVPVYVKQDSGPRPGQQGRIPDAVWAVNQLPEGWT